MHRIAHYFALCKIVLLLTFTTACEQGSHSIIGKWKEDGKSNSFTHFTADGKMLNDGNGEELGTYELLPNDKLQMVLVQDRKKMEMYCDYTLSATKLEISVLTWTDPEGRSREIPPSMKEISYSRVEQE